ncbi:MAG TPA: permease prefix domain 1-containing protein, partial [Pyrinomonadaceae bacterium]
MLWLRNLLARIAGVWRADRIGEEIDRELQFHIDMRTEENIRRGMSPEEARRDALSRFGHRAVIKERSYEVRGGRWLETLWQDTRYGARMLVKHPGFSFVAILTLALGIGANTAIFSIVNGVLLRPLPYPEPESLDNVFQQNSAMNRFGISVADFLGIEKEYAKTGSVAAFTHRAVTLTGGERPEQIKATFATAAFFKTLGVMPERGRAFL